MGFCRVILGWFKLLAAITLISAGPGSSSSSATQAQQQAFLSERWLEEEAAYLITDREKKVFRSLTTREAQERFVAGFWQVRDPTPGTERNEFKDAFEKRRDDANRLFRGFGRPGWRTDRGRLHIMLGPPMERRNFANTSDFWPMEIWFYQSEDRALPPFFYLTFYQRGGAGDYRLWEPFSDGPGALVASRQLSPANVNDTEVYRLLDRIDSDLLQAIRAPVPGGGDDRSSQFEYQKVLAILEDYPNQSMNTSLLDRYRPGEGVVESDYTFRRLELTPLVALLPSSNGTFVHFALQIPADALTYAEHEHRYYSVFDLEGSLTTTDNQSIYEFRDKREIELSASEWEQAQSRPVSLMGRFPVIPGDYQLKFLVRSRNGRVFDRLEFPIRIPESLDTSNLLPARSFERSPSTTESARLAFDFGSTLAVVNPNSDYRSDGKLRAFVVLSGESALPIEISGRVLHDDEAIHELTRSAPPTRSSEASLVAFEIDLGGRSPGSYVFEIRIGDEQRSLPFTVDSRETPPPIVSSPTEPAAMMGIWNVERARQFRAMGRNGQALVELESAVRRSPELEMARVQLAVLALALAEPERALDGIVPGLMHAPFHYELLTLAGFASERLDSLDEAASYYERARKLEKADSKLLEALASVYDRLGRVEKARLVRKELP